jgi:hypothetical protein
LARVYRWGRGNTLATGALAIIEDKLRLSYSEVMMMMALHRPTRGEACP